MKKVSNIALLILILTACGGVKNAVIYETTSNISDSAVHDYYVVGLEELSNESGDFSNSTEVTVDVVVSTDSADSVSDNTEQIVLDVWDMGLEWYGISYLDTTRTLKLISYEGYGYSRLSYYVACCCWARATENYWGYPNLYAAFGQNDESYWGDWLDDIWIADWAYDALDECYRNPTYCMYCNGVIEPYNYMYAEWSEGDGCMIYCWND